MIRGLRGTQSNSIGSHRNTGQEWFRLHMYDRAKCRRSLSLLIGHCFSRGSCLRGVLCQVFSCRFMVLVDLRFV